MTPTLLLLPGLDGTGELFAPFLEALPDDVSTKVVSYPRDRLVGRRGLGPIVRARSDVTVETFDAPHLVVQTRPHEAADAILRFL